MAISLNNIIPWGRTYEEYRLMFNLHGVDFAEGVLDCGGGPASFTAQAVTAGHRAVAVDPLYAYAGAAIQSRYDETEEMVLSQVRATPNDWAWTYHKDPDDLRKHRRQAIAGFLDDYDQGKAQGRYVVGELPALPFVSNTYGIAVCSHLLFLYSDLLSETFHVRAVAELGRVAREIRIFPLLDLSRKLSPHVETVRKSVANQGWRSEIQTVDYELQRGGNQMLRIFK